MVIKYCIALTREMFDAFCKRNNVKDVRWFPAVVGALTEVDFELVSVETMEQIERGRHSIDTVSSVGQVGCYLSHTILWRWLLSEPDGTKNEVYEDDAILKDDALRYAASVMNDVERDKVLWDVYNFAYTYLVPRAHFPDAEGTTVGRTMFPRRTRWYGTACGVCRGT